MAVSFKRGLSSSRTKREENHWDLAGLGEDPLIWAHTEVTAGDSVFIRSQFQPNQHRQEGNWRNPWQGPKKAMASHAMPAPDPGGSESCRHSGAPRPHGELLEQGGGKILGSSARGGGALRDGKKYIYFGGKPQRKFPRADGRRCSCPTPE